MKVLSRKFVVVNKKVYLFSHCEKEKGVYTNEEKFIRSFEQNMFGTLKANIHAYYLNKREKQQRRKK